VGEERRRWGDSTPSAKEAAGSTRCGDGDRLEMAVAAWVSGAGRRLEAGPKGWMGQLACWAGAE
jgi:hypothetical protein